MMDKLAQNITSKYGKQGELWLANIPETLTELSTIWDLDNITTIAEMSWHYIAAANFKDQPVIIKLGFAKEDIQAEAMALVDFKGLGFAGLLDYLPAHNALLIERILPGQTMLSGRATIDDSWLIKKYHNLVSNYSFARHLDGNYKNYRHWLKAFSRVLPSSLPYGLGKLVPPLMQELTDSTSGEYLLHGDLHLENILLDQQEGTHAIDPKGIIGPIEFEIAWFNYILPDEYRHDFNQLSTIYERRLKLVAGAFGVSSDYLNKWVLLRYLLAISWHIEDGTKPDNSILTARIAFRLLSD